MSLATFFRQLRREARGGRARLLFCMACVGVGVGAVVAVAGFCEGLERGIRAESRQLLAADLSVRGRRPIPPEVAQQVERIAGARHTQVRELLTLIAAVVPPTPETSLPRPPLPASGPGALRSLLVELKSIDGVYPFYGRLELEPDRPLDELLSPENAIVAPEVLRRLGLRVGDALRIGHAEFRIVAILRKEPDRIASAFTLGPRLLLRDWRGPDWSRPAVGCSTRR